MSLLALLLVMILVALVATVNDGYPATELATAAFTAAELESLQTAVQSLPTTVATTLDSVVADNYCAAEWKVTLTKDDGTTIVRVVKAWHNGTASADATTAQCSITGGGWMPDTMVLDVDLSGVGTAQVMRLRCTLTYASGAWKGSSWRVPQKPPQYA